MDQVLETTLELAYTVRDSAAAEGWRLAWGHLLNMPYESGPPSPYVETGPFTHQLRKLRWCDWGAQRPVLFPILIRQYLGADEQRVVRELSAQPETAAAYNRLVDALGLFAFLLHSLRRSASGFPNAEIIQAAGLMPSPWTELTNDSEIPYGRGGWLTAGWDGDPRFTSLACLDPPTAAIVSRLLAELTSRVRDSDVGRRLAAAHQNMLRNRNLLPELRRALLQLNNEIQVLIQRGVTRSELHKEMRALAERIYATRGRRIREYVASFLAYEGLLRRIYWTYSHVVFHGAIMCLSSAESRQLQQVLVSFGDPPTLTALSPVSPGSQPSSLICLSLPEAGDQLEGLYQIREAHGTFHTAKGERVYFMAHRLWAAKLTDLRRATSAARSPIFKTPAEDSRYNLENMRMVFGTDDRQSPDYRFGDFVVKSRFVKTMFVPLS